MLLSTAPFFVFLCAIFFLYWPLSRIRLLGLGVLLFGNYLFYARWDLVYLAIIPLASSVDFLIGLGLQRLGWAPGRRALVTLSVAMNLSLLASTRYMPFLLDNYSAVSGQSAPEWHWLFPLGLSFYVFQSLTYTIDVYRRDAKATTSYLAHLTATSFFPTTLAGPITRVSYLIQQFTRKDLGLSNTDSGRAFYLICLGLIKKLLIADYLGDNLVNRVFDNPGLYSGAEALIGVYGYALQLYYDFSGYTDIARGAALLVGIKLPINFNRPYAAVNIADFWRRWHISLSNWLRDYLYFSLPGLRSKWRIFAYWNLFLTMVLGGLWHGPSWNFVIWGALHGGALALLRAWQTGTGNVPPSAHPAAKLARIFVTAQFVCFCWVFFRAETLPAAFAVLERIGSLSAGFENVSAGLWVVLAVAVLAHYIPAKWFDWTAARFETAPFYAQAAAVVLLIAAVQYVGATGAAPFIYTQF